MSKPQTEKEFLKSYDASVFERPNTLVDTLIFTVLDGDLHVLIVKRTNHPFMDKWALVGGFVDVNQDKDIQGTAMRKLQEKTGVKAPYLEQYGSVGNSTRDPRGWSVTNIYFALIPNEGVNLQAGEGASDIKWARIIDNKVKDKLAFDHAEILKGCLERLRNKVLYTSIPVYLLPKTFTLRDLQNIYETILDRKLEHKSFRRRMINADILEETGDMTQDKGRPAMLYRIKKGSGTHYFMRNIEGAS